LFGNGTITTFVLGVIAFSRSSAVSLNSFSAFKSRTLAVAPVNAVHPLYATKLGSGTITSSPGPTNALRAISIPSLPPTVTIISSSGL